MLMWNSAGWCITTSGLCLILAAISEIVPSDLSLFILPLLLLASCVFSIKAIMNC